MIEKLITIEVIGKQPSEQELKMFPPKMLTKEAIDEAKEAYKKDSITTAVVYLIFAFVSILIVVLHGYIISNDIEWIRTGILRFLINPALISIPIILTLIFVSLAIYKFATTSGTFMPKSPQSLYESIFKDIYLEGLPDNAHEKLKLIVPEMLLIAHDSLKSYIENFQHIISEKQKNVDKTLREEFDKNALLTRDNELVQFGAKNAEVEINKTELLYMNVYETHATIEKTTQWQIVKNNAMMQEKYENYANVTVKLNINCVLLKEDEYWFPYDLVPEIKQVSLSSRIVTEEK